jgi:glycosyltransferase involved in cell wall biosynthesis
MIPVILGILVIDRPKTTEKCIQQLLKWNRDKFIFVVVDNNSNEETKDVLQKYKKDLDLLITNDCNVGCSFAMNQYMSMREPGQHFMKVDVDAHVISPDWMDLLLMIAKEPDLGIIMGRRPNFWHTDERFRYFSKFVKRDTRGYIPVEIVTNPMGCVWPFGLIKSELIDKIGYVNEALCIDDLEYGARAYLVHMAPVYLPDVVITQWYHTSKHPDLEEQHHPEYASYHALFEMHKEEYLSFFDTYVKGNNIYCGSRFDLGSISDTEYQRKSDANWDFCKNYLKNKREL